MAEIAWTAEAESWLRDIYEYISRDSPEAAARVVESIYERAQILREFPEAGFRYLQRPDREIRILLWGHYRITYVVKGDGNVDIIGVFHGALDIERLIL
jgi:plasmid stabilization system protein ParE